MPVSGPTSRALWGVRGGIRNGSPACSVSVGFPSNHHLDRAGEDVADLLAGMLMPARLDTGGDLGEHLDDLASGNRGRGVLELGPLEFLGELVDRLLVRSIAGRLPPTPSGSWSVTAPGWEIMITCEPSSSTMSAPARSAIERMTSAPAALSPVATTAQDGSVFQAGGPVASLKAELGDRPLGGGHQRGLLLRAGRRRRPRGTAPG